MDIFYISLLTFLASVVGTLTGFGTSTIMMSVLLFFLPLPQALVLVGVIHWFGDVWKIVLFKKGLKWKIILTFGIVGVVFSFLGAKMVFSISEQILLRILGAFFVFYVFFLFWKPNFKLPANLKTTAVGGALSGFFAGLLGVGGAIRGLFLSAFNLPKAVYLATAGASAILIDTTRIITYLANKATIEKQFLWGMFLFIPISFLGAILAKKIVNKVPQKNFRTLIAVFIFLVGLKFLLFP